MLAGVITSLAMLVTIGLWVYSSKKKAVSQGEDFHYSQIIGQYGIESSIIGIILLWLVTWGSIIILHVLILI